MRQGFKFKGGFVKFYHRLHSTDDKPGVLPKADAFPIVCEEYIANYNGEPEMFHRFFALPSMSDLVYLIMTTQNAHYYEVIRGNRPQKPFFDVDMPANQVPLGKTPYTILEDLIDAIILEGIKREEIVVCETNCPNKTKFSFHVVVLRAVMSCLHAAAFAENVFNRMTSESAAFIDLGVYNKNRQLRLLCSSKLRLDGKPPRVKLINQEYTKRKLSGNGFDVLLTLVTHTSGLDPLHINVNEEIVRREISSIVGFTDDQIEELKSFIPEYAEFDKCEIPFILLKRLHSSYCDVCQRVHEFENLYLLVFENGIVELSCRRNKRRQFVGVLSTPLEVIDVGTSVDTPGQPDDDTSPDDTGTSAAERIVLIKEAASLMERPFKRPS